MTAHKKKVHVDKTKKDFKCDLCDFTTWAKSYLISHKSIVHKDSKHICEKCGKKFKYPYGWFIKDNVLNLNTCTFIHGQACTLHGSIGHIKGVLWEKTSELYPESYCYFHSCHFTEFLNFMNSK